MDRDDTHDDDSLTELIRILENERYAAMIAGDVGALDRLLSDRLVYGHSNAEPDSKDSFLERVRDRTFVYESIDHPEERIIIAGGAVVVLGAMIANVYLPGELRTLRTARARCGRRKTETGGWWLTSRLRSWRENRHHVAVIDRAAGQSRQADMPVTR